MSREELIERITREVVRALADDAGGSTATVRGGSVSAGGTSDGSVPADGMLDLCRDLGICRVGGSPGTQPAPGLGAMIDHTVLKPDADRDVIRKLCAEARENSFASVCVQPWWVPVCAEMLAGSVVAVCTVIGFPHGMNKPETKAFETRRAVLDGATEVDMVINIGALKSKDYGTVERDIRAVVESARPNALVKVILENAYLTDEEKAEGCVLAKAAGADFVKTSTGFAAGGATVEDIALMRRVVGSEMGVKAAGGIRDAAGAKQMIEAGATRIGASASIEIVRGA